MVDRGHVWLPGAALVLPGILEIREALPVTPANDSGCDAF